MIAARSSAPPADTRATGLFIRRAGRGDVQGVAELWERSGLPPSRRGFRREIARLRRRDPELVLIALFEGRLVGAIAGSYDGRTAVLSRLAVDGRVRRRGVGRLLVEALRDQLYGLGAQDDELVVLDGGEQTDAFWSALGFERGKVAAYLVRDRNRSVTRSASLRSGGRPRRPPR